MEEKIIKIIEEICEIENIKENMDIDLIEEDLLDSLGFISLVAALEDEFNIEIQPTEVPSDTWRSIDKIIELVKKLKNM